MQKNTAKIVGGICQVTRHCLHGSFRLPGKVIERIIGCLVPFTLVLSGCAFTNYGAHLYGKGQPDFTFQRSQPVYVGLPEAANTTDKAFQTLLSDEMKRLGFQVTPQLSQESLILFFAMNSNSSAILAPLPGNAAISRLPEQWQEVSLELFSLNHIDGTGPVWTGYLRVKRKEFHANPAGALTPLLELVGKNYEGPISVPIYKDSQPAASVKMTQEQQARMQNLERRIQQLESEQKKTGETAGIPASQATVATVEAELQATCHNGMLEACVSLAELYLKGGEIPADPQRAAQLYEEACSRQNGKACTNLGLLYYQGVGVSKDLPRSKDFFQRGCRFHDKLGCTLTGGIQ